MFASRTNWPLDPNRFTRALEKHRSSGKRILDLTASNPTTCGLDYPAEEILAALSDPRALTYRPESKGLHEARQAVADYYSGRAGFSPHLTSVDPERILLTSGTSEGYSHIFRLLCDAGDEILVPAPSYPLLEFLADLADIRLVPYTLVYDNGWQIDFASLRAALTPRSRAVVVVHPNNPTGSFVKPSEAAELAAICASREMAIVADEVFLDYSLNRVRPRLEARQDQNQDQNQDKDQSQTFALHDAALTFTLSGLSKISLLPQMKLAWVVVSGPESLAQASTERLEIIADTYLSPSTPVQLALPKLLSLRHALQTQLQRRLIANLSVLDAVLVEAKSLTRLHLEGGWYAILRVPVIGTDEDVAVNLLEHCSVLFHPGHFFDFSRDGFLVLSLITPELEFEEGVRRVVEFFAK